MKSQYIYMYHHVLKIWQYYWENIAYVDVYVQVHYVQRCNDVDMPYVTMSAINKNKREMQAHLNINEIYIKVLIKFNTIFSNMKIYLSLQITISCTVMPIFITCFNCSKLYTFPWLVLIIAGFNLSCLNNLSIFYHLMSLINNCKSL